MRMAKQPLGRLQFLSCLLNIPNAREMMRWKKNRENNIASQHKLYFYLWMRLISYDDDILSNSVHKRNERTNKWINVGEQEKKRQRMNIKTDASHKTFDFEPSITLYQQKQRPLRAHSFFISHSHTSKHTHTNILKPFSFVTLS